MASSYSAEQFEQLLKCSVCLDRLNSPKILPCQHTFCKSPCIEGLIDWGSRRLKCPECRKEHFVPRDGADGFPNNITIMGFLDLPPSRRPNATDAAADTSDAPAGAAAAPAPAAAEAPAATSRKCGVCEEEAESLIKCFHCQKMVCATCKQSHAGQIKLDIGRLINQIRRGIPKLSNCISLVEGQAETVKQQVEGVKSDIRRTFETYIKELQEREKLLTSELDTFLQGELRGLRIQQENVEVELASISSYCDSTESLLNQSNSTPVPEADLAGMKTQCAEYMTQIRQTESQPIPQTRKARFRSDGSHIHANIRNLGEVTVQTPGGLRVTNNVQGTVNNRSNIQLNRPPQPTTTAPVNPPTVAAPRTNHPSVNPPTVAAPRTNHPPVNPPTVTAPRMNYPRPTHTITPRETWMDRDLDDDFFRNFGIEPDTPRDPVPAPSQDRRNRPNVNPYMFRMPTHSAVTNSIDRAGEYWRRHLEAQNNRQRVNATSIFGAEAMFDEPPEAEGFTDGSDRSSIPRRPIRTFHDDPPVGAAGRGAGRGRAASENYTSAASAPASFPQRPAAAFMVPLDRATPVDLTHRSNEDVSTTHVSRRRETTNQAGNRVGYRGSRSYPERNRTRNPTRETNNDTRRNATRETNINNNTSRNPDRERSNNRSERSNNRSERNNTNSNNRQQAGATGDHQAGTTGDPDSNPRRVRPGTVVLSRGTRPLPTANPPGNENQSNSNVVNDNQNNANGDITSTSRTSNTSTSRHNTTAESTIEATTDALNETLGDLLIDSEEEEEEINVSEIPGPQDSLTVVNSLHRYRIKQEASLQLGGERGNAPAQFACPRGVAICPVSGSIIIADSSNHRIQVFSNAGEIIHHFGSFGQAHGEFDCLAGVAVNLMGEIIVADRYNHRVQVFDRYGTFSHAFGEEGAGEGQLNYPWGIAVDRSGFIYVCDKENSRVQIFQENGTFVRTIGSQESEVENPHYVAISEDNMVVVSDTNNHRIQVFTTTGRLVKCFGSEGQDDGQFLNPKGIAVDSQGFIIVADSGNHRVQIFRGNGDFFYKFGSEGTEPGQFKGMEGLAVTTDGKIVVSDKENHRVQIF